MKSGGAQETQIYCLNIKPGFSVSLQALDLTLSEGREKESELEREKREGESKKFTNLYLYIVTKNGYSLFAV